MQGDARSDATSDGGRDGGDATLSDGATDASDATATDSAPDAAAGWYGFRACGAPPVMMLAPEPAFPRAAGDGGADAGFVQVTGINAPRDINFDGVGNMIVAGRDSGNIAAMVVAINAAGTSRTFYTAAQGTFSGARFLTNGNVVISGSFMMGASIVPGITLLDSMGAVQGRLAFPSGYPWASLSQDNGGFIVFDSTLETQIIQFASGPLPAALPTRVDTSAAMPPAPTQQRGGVMSADGRHLFVASQDNGLIHEYEVSAAGVINGASRRLYVNLGTTAFPRSLAFDECGNLYVSASGMVGGTTTGVVLRVGPRATGGPLTIAAFEQSDSQRTIAFGAGPGFSNTHLYVADVSPQIIRRINIGIAGQPMPSPGTTGMMMPRDM